MRSVSIVTSAMMSICNDNCMENDMNEPGTIMVKMTLLDCAEYCRPKVVKLRPGKKSGVINGIKNAFNFKAEITDATAEKIYGLLLNRKVFSEEDGKIIWPQRGDGSNGKG